MMTDTTATLSKLQKLELDHADREELQDIRNAEALATDLEKIQSGYYISMPLIGAMAGISLSTTASYWGFSPTAAIIANVNADIGPSPNAALFSIVWTISNAIGLILFGRISDKFGRRWFVVGASCLGLIGGIVACLAQNMNTLIGANVLLGLAAGVHTCYGLTVGEICPNRYKFIGVAIVVIPSVIPTGFGAYLAVMLTQTANWRWIYYIFIILMAIATILLVLFYHPPGFSELHGGSRTVAQELKRVDWVGTFLLVAGLILFMLGVSWGGTSFPWNSARILGLLISGVVALIAYALWEIYSHTTNPLVPMHFFKDVRGFTMLFIISVVSGTVYTATAIIWPSQVAVVYASTITSWQTRAWASTTIAFGIWSGIVILGPLISVIKHVRWQLIIMMTVSVAFLGSLASCNKDNLSQSAAFSFLATFPAGILEVMTGLLVQLNSHDSDLGTCFSVIFLGRTAVGAIFTAVFIAILTNKLPTELQSHVTPAALDSGLPASSLAQLFTAITTGDANAISQVPGMTDQIATAVGGATADGYAAAYRYVYYAAVAVGAVGILACIFIMDYDPYFTNHVSRKIHLRGQASDADSTDKPKEVFHVSDVKEETTASHHET